MNKKVWCQGKTEIKMVKNIKKKKTIKSIIYDLIISLGSNAIKSELAQALF